MTARQPKSFTTLSVFLSGGLGDIWAIESHLPLFGKPDRIYLATPRQEPVAELFAPLLPDTTFVPLWHPSFNFGYFICRQHCTNTLRHFGLSAPAGLEQAEDLSIAEVFPRIEAGQLPFVGSSLIAPKPPTATLFVHSQTIRPPVFDAWDGLIERLERDDLTAVVCGPCPDHARLTRLHGSITEAVAALCRCVGYVGINSCFSVLAAQLFDANALTIYGGTDWPLVYYAPHREFKFLRP